MDKVLSDLFDCVYILLLLADGGYQVKECYDENDIHQGLSTYSKNIFNTVLEPAIVAVIKVEDHSIIKWKPILCYSEAKNHVKEYINEATK